ncbi:MAG: hypothetical protein AAF518_26025, partial [Spirochaetota bacterium]
VNTDVLLLLTKLAVEKEFKTGGRVLTGGESYTFTSGEINSQRKIVKEIYKITQQEIKSIHPSQKITLYKGVYDNVDQGKVGNLSSWTSDYEVAKMFAGGDKTKIFKRTISTEQVFNFHKSSIWKNGMFGDQKEYIIMEK